MEFRFEEMTFARIHEIVHPILNPLLSAANFDCVDCLKWVRSSSPPIRPLFEFQKVKGGRLIPIWGVSLDFVPHISGRQVRWHRTPKSALLDLTAGPFDDTFSMSYIGGAKAITDHAPLSLPRAVHEAAIFWSNALTVEQLPSAIDELRMSYARSRGLGFYNLTQHAIAAALVMAGAGRLAEARADFQRYFDAAVELQKLKPPDQLKLSAIFEDAVAHPPQ